MNSSFLEIAFSRQIVVSALKVALIVGTILALINHGNKIFNLSINYESALQIALTYLVPYCVATYSAARALQNKPFNQN